MRHVPRGDVAARGVDVVLRVVEEDVRAEGLQERALRPAAEEQRFVEAHVPLAQRADHALVRRRAARGDERGADRRGFAREQGATPVSYPVACLPQAWAAGAGFMLLQACLGVEVDGWRGEIQVTDPQLPLGIDNVVLRGILVGQHRVDVQFQRFGRRVVAFCEGLDADVVPLRVTG